MNPRSASCSDSTTARERENKRWSPSMDMDRLSSLPDEVICHILSFLLRTKSSVQTSVLSKRWRFLWAGVPVLRFDSDDTRRADIITNIVFQQHKHDIHTFCISIGNLDDYNNVHSWIVHINTRNIRNLVIAFKGNSYGLKLPQCLFTCNTLVDLSLYWCGGIPMSYIYFPALKKLKLDFVEFKSHESLAHLISGCPLLEELSIKGITLGHTCVSSPTLTEVELTLNYDYRSFVVNLDTPALRYLQLISFMPNELSAGALDSLIEAKIALLPLIGKFIYPRNVLPFVGKLCNVKLLTLTICEMPLVNDSVFSASDIKFHNLTKLNLSADLGFITFFLENANNLKVLEFMILSRKVDNDDDNEYSWREPKQVPACLISHLQTVTLCQFESFELGLDVLRYVLVNAKVLKMMKVSTAPHHKPPHKHDWEKKLETLKKVALFERGSKECELVIDLDCPSH